MIVLSSFHRRKINRKICIFYSTKFYNCSYTLSVQNDTLTLSTIYFLSSDSTSTDLVNFLWWISVTTCSWEEFQKRPGNEIFQRWNFSSYSYYYMYLQLSQCHSFIKINLNAKKLKVIVNSIQTNCVNVMNLDF